MEQVIKTNIIDEVRRSSGNKDPLRLIEYDAKRERKNQVVGGWAVLDFHPIFFHKIDISFAGTSCPYVNRKFYFIKSSSI